jgi:Secretion system C-terminal sorting domain
MPEPIAYFAIPTLFFVSKGQAIKILNVMGEIILEKKVNNDNFQIETGNLSPGIYFLQCESQLFKFIKI